MTHHRTTDTDTATPRAIQFDLTSHASGLVFQSEAISRHDNGLVHCYGRADVATLKGVKPDSAKNRVYYSAWHANVRSDGTVKCASATCEASITLGSGHRAHVIPKRHTTGCYCGVNIVITCADCNDSVEYGATLRSDWVFSTLLLSGQAIVHLGYMQARTTKRASGSVAHDEMLSRQLLRNLHG